MTERKISKERLKQRVYAQDKDGYRRLRRNSRKGEPEGKENTMVLGGVTSILPTKGQECAFSRVTKSPGEVTGSQSGGK